MARAPTAALRRALLHALEGANDARRTIAPMELMLPGAGLGAIAAGLSGGDGDDVLRGAGYGMTGAMGMRALGALPGSAKMLALPGLGLPIAGGVAAVHGDEDAAARKIIMMSRRDPAKFERVAAILYGERPRPEEMTRNGRGRPVNIYGVSATDTMGSMASGTTKERALRRAYELIQENE